MKFFKRFKTDKSQPAEQPSAEPASADELAQQSETPLESSSTEMAAEPATEIAPNAEVLTAEPSLSPTSAPASVAEQPEKKAGLFSRLKAGLKRTSGSLGSGLGNLFLGKKQIDNDLLEELETHLLMADVGIEATQEIINSLTQQVSRKELADGDALYAALQQELKALLQPSESPLVIANSKTPYVILMVGVNGVGKTTTIGKLAKRFQAEGKSVMLAAGDTFRAAAVEQLQVWGDRNNVPVIAQHTGADSASVIFDAVQAAQARNIDVLIADTAGRLHNKDNLMEELRKVVRVMGKLDDSAPHEVMLVLDAGTGQNALSQAKAFQEVVGVSGITLTKLDGTAKGGIIFAISKQLNIPIRFIGVGEQVDDLRPFVAEDFIKALFATEQ
ncbi:signal recognition particle-docking protein FtsY [Dasania marina]|uniref:signal recognition particle-docking protein FtsY n=1 Tax=Dasania marina TaxID=471499 RepID=UPI0030D84978|tara:strand:+ start:15739 stop:16902 length:1164 start_codon:yes stop_codon:yes gene_type:complete